MSDDQLDWLDVREPHDHASRSKALAQQFLRHLSLDGRIIDLACGSGSNARYLQPISGERHRWICIDHDASLLKRASTNFAASRFNFRERCLASDLTEMSFSATDAVTTSAFLDMTSASWLDQFSKAIASVPFLAAMTVCGPVSFQPNHPADALIQTQLLSHQCRDHGFGPSVGPEANNYLASRLGELGNLVTIERSDWKLGPVDQTTQRIMITGIARRIRLMSSDSNAPKIAIES